MYKEGEKLYLCCGVCVRYTSVNVRMNMSMWTHAHLCACIHIWESVRKWWEGYGATLMFLIYNDYLLYIHKPHQWGMKRNRKSFPPICVSLSFSILSFSHFLSFSLRHALTPSVGGWSRSWLPPIHKHGVRFGTFCTKFHKLVANATIMTFINMTLITYWDRHRWLTCALNDLWNTLL